MPHGGALDRYMKLRPDITKPNRTWMTFLGSLKSLLAMFMFWVGINSFLIGVAYNSLKGSWMPRISGIFIGLLGILLLHRGIRQVMHGLWPHLAEKEEDVAGNR